MSISTEEREEREIVGGKANSACKDDILQKKVTRSQCLSAQGDKKKKKKRRKEKST